MLTFARPTESDTSLPTSAVAAADQRSLTTGVGRDNPQHESALECLHQELLDMVVDHGIASMHPVTGQKEKRDFFLALCKTSRRLYHTFLPMLYRQPLVFYTTLTPLVRTLIERPCLAKYITLLDLHHGNNDGFRCAPSDLELRSFSEITKPLASSPHFVSHFTEEFETGHSSARLAILILLCPNLQDLTLRAFKDKNAKHMTLRLMAAIVSQNPRHTLLHRFRSLVVHPSYLQEHSPEMSAWETIQTVFTSNTSLVTRLNLSLSWRRTGSYQRATDPGDVALASKNSSLASPTELTRSGWDWESLFIGQYHKLSSLSVTGNLRYRTTNIRSDVLLNLLGKNRTTLKDLVLNVSSRDAVRGVRESLQELTVLQTLSTNAEVFWSLEWPQCSIITHASSALPPNLQSLRLTTDRSSRTQTWKPIFLPVFAQLISHGPVSDRFKTVQIDMLHDVQKCNWPKFEEVTMDLNQSTSLICIVHELVDGRRHPPKRLRRVQTSIRIDNFFHMANELRDIRLVSDVLEAVRYPDYTDWPSPLSDHITEQLQQSDSGQALLQYHLMELQLQAQKLVLI